MTTLPPELPLPDGPLLPAAEQHPPEPSATAADGPTAAPPGDNAPTV